jgi:Glycosyltransferase 61
MKDMDVTVWHVREALGDKAVESHSEPYRPQVHLTDDIPTREPSDRETAADTADVSVENQNPQSTHRAQAKSKPGRIINVNLHGRKLKQTGPPRIRNKIQLLSMDNGMSPVFVIYKGSMANFGHFIWDDYLSLYSQLDLLDLADDDSLMPIPFVQDPPKYVGGSYCSSDNGYVFGSCTSFMKRLYPSLWNMDTDCSGDVVRTENWLQGRHTIGNWNQHPSAPCGDYRDNITNVIDAEYVIVPNVTVGSGRLALFSCYGDCTLGRGPQLFRFRNYLMRRMLGHSHATNPKGFITFSLAHGASRGKGEVTFFEDEIAAARLRYGDAAVKAVDFAQMSLEEQAKLIANSAVLFTNHGGGSASTVFLPKGASAFVYWRSQQRDNEFYRSVAYFRTEWIEYNQRRDVARTMRLLEMELIKTARMYPHMICFDTPKANSSESTDPSITI